MYTVKYCERVIEFVFGKFTLERWRLKESLWGAVALCRKSKVIEFLPQELSDECRNRLQWPDGELNFSIQTCDISSLRHQTCAYY